MNFQGKKKEVRQREKEVQNSLLKKGGGKGQGGWGGWRGSLGLIQNRGVHRKRQRRKGAIAP